MDQELNDRLARIEKMVGDNSRMLSSMRAAQKRAGYFKLLYWLVIVILAIASFYAIKPYIAQFGAAYGLGSSSGTTETPSTTSTVMELLKQYQESKKAAQ
ncbi:MAG: hypothetical protein V4478_01270 [Patescibacteria group bacterium]